jgi:ATP-dependent 26S proteasome regulatory subunit
MLANDELILLIRSKYPVIFVESIDEEYVINRLMQITGQLGLILYQWSATAGLQRGTRESRYYQTEDPEKMIKTVLTLIKSDRPEWGLFVFKDFHKYLDSAIILRLFKDLVNLIRNTKNTVVILSPEYKLPKDIETDAAHIVGGYPDEQEITLVIQSVFNEFVRSGRGKVSLTVDETQKMVKALKGLSVQQIRNIIHQCIVDDRLIDIADLKTIESYKKKLFDQEGLLEYCLTEDKESIAGFSNLKRWLSERKGSFSESASLPPPRGVLLMGVQGCGKSLSVKAIAKELALPLYRLDIGKLYGQYIGQTEQNLRKALDTVDKLAPMCLWLDEIEKGFAASAGESDGGVSQRVLGTFLTWMQERKSVCFLAATANDIYRLPPEFLRKGRFDEIFFVDLPDCEMRNVLFQIHLKKRNLNPESFDCRLLAETAADFSGAEIEQAIIPALYSASSKKESISTNHVLDQINLTRPLALLKQEEITALREWARERTITA